MKQRSCHKIDVPQNSKFWGVKTVRILINVKKGGAIPEITKHSALNHGHKNQVSWRLLWKVKNE